MPPTSMSGLAKPSSSSAATGVTSPSHSSSSSSAATAAGSSSAFMNSQDDRRLYQHTLTAHSHHPSSATSPSHSSVLTSPNRHLASSPPPAASLAHLYSSPPLARNPVTALTIPLSPEQKARQLIHMALRDASSGHKPLAHISVCAHRVVDNQLVLYDVLVQGSNNLKWLLTRRFAEFATLNSQMETAVRNVETLPPFPSKEWRFMVDHLSPDFLAQRLALLDNFMKKILQNAKLRSTSSFLDFLRPSKEDLMDENESNGNQNHKLAASSSSSGKGRDPSYLSPYSSASSPSRASALASNSMNEDMFEPRSFEEEAVAERRERVASAAEASDGGAVEINSESPSALTSRRTSRSQNYEPQQPAHISFVAPNSTPALSSIYDSSNGYNPFEASHTGASMWISPEISDVCIPAAQILKNDHGIFQVNCENIQKLSSFSKWTVLKRYQDFFRLDSAIREEIQRRELGGGQKSNQAAASSSSSFQPSLLSKLPMLPKKESKLFTDHLQNRFIEKRRLLLEVYLKKLITVPEIVEMDVVLDFLGCN